MNNLEFMKWMFAYAGWDVDTDGEPEGEYVVLPNGECKYLIHHIGEIEYSNLLQKAIEGWNIESTDNRYIRQNYDSICVMDASITPHKEESRHEAEEFDDAKNSVLSYLYEQEK